MPNIPLISILVPVYNGSKYIRRFLDSALNQIFQDFEIICVDDISTDDTLDVLEEYRQRFSDKIFVYSAGEHCGSIGKMRNLAYSYSHGKYIYWCDQDDILHPCGLRDLYEEAEKNNSDIVCGWAQIVRMDDEGEIVDIQVLNKKQTQQASIQASILNGIDYWVRLIRRELIEKVGPIPEHCYFDDVAYLPVLHTNAEKINFVNSPIYYYHRRADSASGNTTLQVCQGSVRAEKYALENSNQKHIQAVEYFVASRTEYNLSARREYFDIFVNWAKEQMEWVQNNPTIAENKALANKMRWAASVADYETVPENVFVVGFIRKPSEERLAHIQEKAFYNDFSLTVLDKENCDINENTYVKRAYENGNYEVAESYFVLKNIYQHGGFYIGNRIKLLKSLGYYRYHATLFFRIDERNYSDSIFAAPPKSEVIADILKTYSDKWDKKNKYMPLSERIKTIITAKYAIPLDNTAIMFRNIVSVETASNCLVNIGSGLTLVEHDFSDFASDEEYVTIRRSTLSCLACSTADVRISNGKTQRERALEGELAALKRSNTWKLMMKIRKIGDGPMGPFLKKIFHGLLKIREKFKRK